MAEKQEGLMLEYFVPIKSSAELDGDFTINGIAINETTTSNGHQFVGEELSKSANTLIGVPLLKDHNNSVDSIVGKVNTAHWDEALRNVPFKAVVKDAKVKQLIQDGLLNSVSVGAHVDPKDIEEMEDGTIRPHNIQFKELSVVAIGADGGATFGMALNNAYKSYSTKVDLNSTERRFNMTKEEKKTESEEVETPEVPKEEPTEEPTPEVSEEEKAVDEKIAKLRIAAKKKKLKLMEADADEAEKPEEKKEEPEEEEEEETEEDEVEEKGDYKFNQTYNSFGIERKSYVYN